MSRNRSFLFSAALTPALALVWASPATGETREEPAAPKAAQAKAPNKTSGKKASAAEAKNAVPGATVEVSGSKGADELYRVEAVNSLGPLGSAKLLDIPNDIAIIPATLLENVQVTSLRDAFKYVPLVQFQEMQGSEILRPATRGMQGSNYQNTRLDGMTIFVTGPNPLESMQQVEVFSGLPASVFGPSNPAGVFNFVSKRPTNDPLQRVDLGYNSENILMAHADVSGKLGEAVGYRFNLLDAHGTSYVSNSELDRKLASLAVDVHPTRDSRIEFNFSAYDLIQKGYPGWFTYAESSTKTNTLLPAAPDPTKVGFGQSYAGIDIKNQNGSVRFVENLAPNWILVVGGLAQGVDRNITTPVNNLLPDNSGNYTSSLANGFAPHFGITSDIAYLNGSFSTGSVTHDLTVGTTGCKAISKGVLKTPTAAQVLLGNGNIDNPTVLPEPTVGLPDVVDQYTSSVASQQGVNFSDTIGFTSKWSVKVALSQDWMQTRNYKNTGLLTSTYNKNGLSPMPSLIYKPYDNVTYYLTYASSLQQGDIAPAGPLNANQALAPYRSTQYEAGAKFVLPTLNLNFAVFRLERPFAYVNAATNLFEIQGNQVNNGVEASVVGKLTESLRILSGVTVIDATMQDTLLAATNGRNYVGLPKVKSNIMLEYWVPSAPGLVGTLDWQFNGKRPVNDVNSQWTPSYSVFDLGARYSARLCGKATTWRLTVNNLTDVHFWSTIGPSNITGADSGNMTAHLGAPRTVAASMSMTF